MAWQNVKFSVDNGLLDNQVNISILLSHFVWKFSHKITFMYIGSKCKLQQRIVFNYSENTGTVTVLVQ